MFVKSKFSFLNLNLVPFKDGEETLGDFSEETSDLDILNDESEDNSEQSEEEQDLADLEEDDEQSDSDDSESDESDSDEDKTGKKKEKKADKKAGEETEEEDSEEQEEEESNEEEDKELVNGRTTIKAIKTKYPNLFKDFPDLRDAFFREREFSKHFGSVEDAQEAAVKATTFDEITESISTGRADELLDAVGRLGRQPAMTFVNNFLPALLERSPQAYAQVTMPAVKKAIALVYAEGNRLGDKAGHNLRLASQFVSDFLFGEKDPAKFSNEERPQPNPEREQLEQERAEFAQRQYHTAYRDAERVIDTRISREIDKILDPKKELNDFTREALRDKIITEVGKVISSDKAHMQRMTSLWKRAVREGYSGEAKSRIISTYLARAKQSLPSVIAKVKAQGKVSKKSTPEDKSVPNQGKSNPGKSSAQSGRVDYRRTSDLDIIEGREKFVGKR